MTSPLVSGPNMLYRDAAVWHGKGNATIVTVATEQLIYAKRKGNAMSDDDMKAEQSRWAHGLPYRAQTDLDALMTPLRLAGLLE